MDTNLIIVAAYSYFLGSIPFGLVLTKIFLKKDIRKIGSGNIGTTNVLRTGKKSLAGLTLIFDIFKGYLSIYLTSNYFSELIYLAALLCLLGHIFPIWLKFKGGKGVATYLGIIIALSFKFGIIFAISWLVILFLFRFSSLASIVSTLIVFMSSVIYNDFNLNMCLFIFLLIILYTHRENILRIKNKTENKIKL